MVYLTVALVVVGVLGLLNLVLTFGVVRRLKEHTKQLANVSSAPTLGIAVGEAPADFAAATTSGAQVTRSALTEQTLVGFFSPGCEPCATELPKFVERARTMPGGPRQVLAVVDGSAEEAAEYLASLESAAQVVLERSEGPVKSAFRISGYPAMFLLGEGGAVAATGTMVSDLKPVRDVARV